MKVDLKEIRLWILLVGVWVIAGVVMNVMGMHDLRKELQKLQDQPPRPVQIIEGVKP